jgi:ABC-2 type transport system ATP-binding protein
LSVKVDSLTKIYGSQRAIDSISFEVKSGEILGFLGPNGAGKSTTMKIISCYTLATEGSVRINNLDILENPVEIRRHIGYLPEQNPLYEDMYIKEYLLFIARLHKLKSTASRKAEEMIEITGLGPERKKKIGMLSKGYKQRLGLAQALIHDPDVLLLDEPTSGLDPNQVVEIRKLITEIGKSKTIILSSHIMQEVQAMCNRVIIINKGKIVADDQTENLIQQHNDSVLLKVVFKNKVAKSDFKKIDELIHVEQKGDHYLIRLKNISQREKLFDYAVETNNPLLEISPVQENLENIFQQLTNSKN